MEGGFRLLVGKGWPAERDAQRWVWGARFSWGDKSPGTKQCLFISSRVPLLPYSEYSKLPFLPCSE